MQFDRAKLKTVILYTCFKCEPSMLGAVKLHKVLYYADMLSYAATGAPITGATYRKRPLGPTCDNLLATLRELANEGAIEIRESDYFGYRKKEYISRREAELQRLSDQELRLLNEVIDFVCANNTAKTISEYSHNRAWDLADFGAILPYSSVLHLFPTQVSTEALEWGTAQADDIEARRSKEDPLDYVDFAAFRSRVLQARGAG
jgi:hypothetical protein